MRFSHHRLFRRKEDFSLEPFHPSHPLREVIFSGSAGCTLTTARGIGIGSSEAAVRKAYGAVEEKSEGKRGETFVAGSIYGGVIFQFKAGKVTEIFIGAAAE